MRISKWVPLTYHEIIAQFPRNPVTHDDQLHAMGIMDSRPGYHYGPMKKEQVMGQYIPGIKEEFVYRTYLFGPHLHVLTLEMAKDLTGSTVYMAVPTHDFKRSDNQLIKMHIHGVVMNEYIDGMALDTSISWPGNTSPHRQQDYYYLATKHGDRLNFNEMKLYPNAHVVSGGGNLTYVFAKKEREPLRPAPVGIDMKFGRIGPVGVHAHRYPGQTVPGHDGALWTSVKMDNHLSSYAWVRRS